LIDVETLLAPVSADAPCGEDLEYGAVDALTRAAQIVPEQQIGDSVIPAQEPDWDAVRRQALDLCKETKDLRVAVLLANAAVRTEGWPAFADALAFLDGLLERYWADVHPGLDPDEPDDFTLRVNLIASLADAETTLSYLREAPLVQSVMGRFSLRDILIADGELSHPAHSEEPPPDRALIDAAIRAADAEQLGASKTALDRAIAAHDHIEARLMRLVGAASAPDLSPLSTLLKRAQKALEEALALHPDAAGDTAFTGVDDNAVEATAVTARPPIGGGTGEISGPDDVRRALEAICAYYQRYEPSSPIPMLLERALRLIAKDFHAIIKDLAPAGLAAVEQWRGPQPEESGTSNGSSGDSSW
jgi:type VI secretion system protein ImpA